MPIMDSVQLATLFGDKDTMSVAINATEKRKTAVSVTGFQYMEESDTKAWDKIDNPDTDPADKQAAWDTINGNLATVRASVLR